MSGKHDHKHHDHKHHDHKHHDHKHHDHKHHDHHHHKPEPKPEYYKLWIEDAKAKEGDTLYFKVVLDKEAKHDIVVKYWTHDGSAVKGKDYVAESGTVTIAAGKKEATIDIVTVEDRKYEKTENMFVKIDEHDKYVKIIDYKGEGTIYDDDKYHHYHHHKHYYSKHDNHKYDYDHYA